MTLRCNAFSPVMIVTDGRWLTILTQEGTIDLVNLEKAANLFATSHIKPPGNDGRVIVLPSKAKLHKVHQRLTTMGNKVYYRAPMVLRLFLSAAQSGIWNITVDPHAITPGIHHLALGLCGSMEDLRALGAFQALPEPIQRFITYYSPFRVVATGNDNELEGRITGWDFSSRNEPQLTVKISHEGDNELPIDKRYDLKQDSNTWQVLMEELGALEETPSLVTASGAPLR